MKKIVLATGVSLLLGLTLHATEVVQTYVTHEDFFTKRYRVELSGPVDDGLYQLRYENSADPVDASLITIVVADGFVVAGGSGYVYAGGYPLNDARVTIFMGVPSGTIWTFTGTQYAVPEGSACTISGDSYAIQRIDTGVESGQNNHTTGEEVIIKIQGVTGPYTKDNDLKSGGNQCDAFGMARYSVHAMLVSLNIKDIPLRYSPPLGPAIEFAVTYNQRETQQPSAFTYSNLGPKWTFNWLSYVTDDPTAQVPLTGVFMPGGGAELFVYNLATQTYAPDPQSHAVLLRSGVSRYERRMPDGSKQVFGLSDGSTSYPRRIFMTQFVDPAGNAVTIGYDATFRITTLTDAVGQVTTLAYELASDPLRITKVTDPFGRFATFQYSDAQLTVITDQIGIQSRFTYSPGTDSIDSLTTPYGTTTFVSGQNGTNRWIEMTDPMGGRERVEYRDQAPGIGASDALAPIAPGITNARLDFANTFYWNKQAMLVAPGDYTKAVVRHWLYNPNGSVSGILASEKQPLENRVWYTYAGQPDYLHAGPTANPSQVARVLGDGTTQLYQYEYNGFGKITKAIDPLGRVTSYVYEANNVDLLEIRQTRGASDELLRKFTYNAQHQVLSDTDAAGQTTTYTYNPQGQMLARKNARDETTTFAYGDTVPAGYLASISGPSLNGVRPLTTFTYDGVKRPRAITDSDNYTITIDYDNLDRKTRVTYPDTTYEQFEYTDNNSGAMTLDLTASRDRRGLWTYRHYNGNEQMDSITDPADRTTQYEWCTCGSLVGITDPKSQTTRFARDIQGRIYQKTFADGTTIDYLFEGQSAPNTPGATSRLQSSTDAKNQRTNYVYFADNALQRIDYTDATGQPLSPVTPSVSYTYDPNYNRVATMMDGMGTTTYSYHPVTIPPALGAGMLATIDGPLGNDTIAFVYDERGRIRNRSINGNANSVTWTFDSLGRVGSETNRLGSFTNTYDGLSARLTKMVYPGGASANFSYLPNAQDKRLRQIQNLDDSKKLKKALISQFDYAYDANGQITNWTKSFPGLSFGLRTDFTYDNADQLLEAPLKNASTNAVLLPYRYEYDLAGNRTSETIGNVSTDATHNNLNEIISQTGGSNRTFTYDLNGNMTSDGGTRTFEWDAANRLVAINYVGSTDRSEFSYDGLDRMAQIHEKTGSTVTSTRKFVWCGTERCEFRDANNTTTTRVFGQGQLNGNTPNFFTRDHLGSIREVFTGGGSVVGRYDYDPYGRSTTARNGTSTDFGFTGFYRHSRSNLDFATFRAYDPDLGQWLSRDPIAEDGGINLYSYISGNPINHVDPQGLFAKAAYDYWLDIAANGITKGGIIGYGQAILGTMGMTAIDFWGARGLEDNAERAGSAAGAGCTGESLKYGGLAVGQIAWSALGGYAVNNVLYPFYRFIGPGSLPGFGARTWLTRGPVGTIPYGSIDNAVSLLQIPPQSGVNSVVRVRNVWSTYVAGARRAKKHPEFGLGGGSEYRVGGFFGD